jgi:6,7-dimethyl-8-ribityllumazine synthase
MRLGIVASGFNESLAGPLLERARREAERLGAEASVVTVPGALEIPLALQWLAQSGRFDALVAIGAVIRGETYHFEVVANESARGVMDVALEFGLPVANGILTTEDEAQAQARLDKGAEAVRVAIQMAELRAELGTRLKASAR